jgi:transposase
VESLQEELRVVRAELAAAKAEIVELRARLNQNSQNSSKPPSSDLAGSRPVTAKDKRGRRRKRGGQPGHSRHLSSPPEHVDQVQQYRPPVCKHCRADLTAGEPTGSIVNHYVYELPDIRPIVTDHQCLDVSCPACGLVTGATLPPEVPSGQYGPSVQAMTGLLRGELRQSMRQTSAVLTEVLHVPMSVGMVAKTQDQVSRALAAPFQEAFDQVHRSDRVHADETSWPEDKKRAWLWVAVTSLVTVFLVRASRGAKVAKELLGECFGGLLTTDRYASYGWVEATRRQLCWSHLKRDFKSFLEYGFEAKWIGERLLAQKRTLFRLWHRAREGTLTRVEFQQAARPVRRRILALLRKGSRLPCRKVSGMCAEILQLRPALFTFIDHPGIEPTNNTAERSLRFAVLMRKGCFGSDSTKGSRFIERFLTVRGTLRMQKRSLYSFLKDACTAALLGTPAPSLLLPKCSPINNQIAIAA